MGPRERLNGSGHALSLHSWGPGQEGLVIDNARISKISLRVTRLPATGDAPVLPRSRWPDGLIESLLAMRIMGLTLAMRPGESGSVVPLRTLRTPSGR